LTRISFCTTAIWLSRFSCVTATLRIRSASRKSASSVAALGMTS
jgi:hypothetical protein